MSAKLEVKGVSFSSRLYDDSGSGANKDLITWRPALPENWYYLGPAATNNGTQPYGIIVKELESGTLGRIKDWVMVWSDSGSGKRTDYSLWRAVPEKSDHVAVGGFFVRTHQKPTIDDARGIRTIPKNMLLSVTPNPEVWTDAGSGATADGAVWNISSGGNLLAINSGAFIPVLGYNNPPNRSTFAVDGSKVKIVT